MSIIHFQSTTAGGGMLTLTPQLVQSVAIGPTTAGIRVNQNGDLEQNINNTYSKLGAVDEWLNEKRTNIGENYECRIVNVSLTTPTGPAVNVWQPLNGNSPEWTITTSAHIFSQFTLEIRPLGLTSGVVSAQMDLDAESIIV